MKIAVSSGLTGTLDIGFRYFPSSEICCSRLIPITEPREYVRRHMQSVRHGCSRLRIRACRWQSLFCVDGVIVGMNQIMQHTGMVRMTSINGFE